MIEFVRSHDNDSDIFTKNTTSEIHHRHSEKLIWTREHYELEASRITTGRVLRGIVNHSNSNSESQIESLVESQIESLVESQVDSEWNMRHNRLSGSQIESQVDSEWRHNRLSGTNRYEVLENYDEVENGTSIKSVT